MRVVLFAIFSVLALLPTLTKAEDFSAKVIGISDGDTIRVLVANNQLLRIRVAFLDAPEMHQAFGQRLFAGELLSKESLVGHTGTHET